MTTDPRNLLGANVTRKLSTRIQPERIEMVRSTVGAAATIKALNPMTVSPVNGLWVPWVPAILDSTLSILRGFLWPDDYTQDPTHSQVISVMTAGVIPIDEILGNGSTIWTDPITSPVDFYYVGFLQAMQDPANRSDSLHIIGMGDLLYV